MKIKWGLKIYNKSKCETIDLLEKAIINTEPIFFRTVKECWEYLGFNLPRVGHGYVGNMYYPKQKVHVEYLLTKYRA